MRHTTRLKRERLTVSEYNAFKGYEAAARACAAEIDEMIEEIRSMFTQEVSIDAGFHPRMIGVRGKNLKKVCVGQRSHLKYNRSRRCLAHGGLWSGNPFPA